MRKKKWGACLALLELAPCTAPLTQQTRIGREGDGTSGVP